MVAPLRLAFAKCASRSSTYTHGTCVRTSPVRSPSSLNTLSTAFPSLNSIHGWLSLWGHEEDQLEGPTASFSRGDAAPGLVGRGIPLDWDDPLPEHALELFNAALLAKTANRDLIYFGAVRDARGRALA